MAWALTCFNACGVFSREYNGDPDPFASLSRNFCSDVVTEVNRSRARPRTELMSVPARGRNSRSCCAPTGCGLENTVVPTTGVDGGTVLALCRDESYDAVAISL